MKIKFLKAGTGDSIIIHHDKHNIVIDGGNDPTYLLAEISKIKDLKECIDLLVITHHDDDHIKGVLSFLTAVVKREYGENFIKEIIFNSPSLIQEKIGGDDGHQLSYKQAFETDQLIRQLTANRAICNKNSATIKFGDLSLRFLSPLDEDLKEYKDNAGSYLTSDYKCDWQIPIKTLEKLSNDDSQDKSLPNSTSIVILAEDQKKRVLLAGDVTPSRLEVILEDLAKEAGTESVMFDYIKLPHHCSYRSLNKNIIKKISCRKFIVSTSSKKHYLPNKRGIVKILKHLNRGDEKIEFLFNYEEAMNNLKITPQEKDNYRFTLTKNNESYGISI